MNIPPFTGFQDFIFGDINLKLALCFCLAFGISFFLVPSIVTIAKAKSLFDEPNHRTSHIHKTPTLGGLAIFNGVAISLLIFFDFSDFPKFQYTVAGLLIIFFTGFKDDIIGIDPLKKLIAQLIAVLITIIFGRIFITNLHGFLGIWEINYHIGILVTLVVIVGITNCFNLMDGIDGLAASLGMLVSLTFGTWFYLVGEYNWAIMAAALVGALLAFFYFNVYGKRNKIFMGDTGALLLGFIMAVMAIKFNELNISLQGPWAMRAAPAVSIGIMMVPVYDTIRVFLTRILKNKYPFSPDKTHIHHYLLQLGLSHFQSTMVLVLASMCFIAISWYLRTLSVAWLLLVLFVVATILSYIPILIVEERFKIKKSDSVIH
jgi:UDP-N-acetylmuramyl pentapeptide phosphotransferase/UDP-N-acetylglucosamine-1-phosphate transferase